MPRSSLSSTSLHNELHAPAHLSGTRNIELKLATVSQQKTIPQIRSDKSALSMERDSRKKPQRSPLSNSAEPSPPTQVMPPAKVPKGTEHLSDAEEALGATRLCLITLVKTYMLSLLRHFDFAIPL